MSGINLATHAYTEFLTMYLNECNNKANETSFRTHSNTLIVKSLELMLFKF